VSTLNEILNAVREVVVMNERVTTLTKQLDRLEEGQADLRDRVIRIEAFIEHGAAGRDAAYAATAGNRIGTGERSANDVGPEAKTAVPYQAFARR
jgi:hypothetical protein